MTEALQLIPNRWLPESPRAEELEPKELLKIIRASFKKFKKLCKDMPAEKKLLEKPRIFLHYNSSGRLVSLAPTTGALEYCVKKTHKLVFKGIVDREDYGLYDLPTIVRRVSEAVRVAVQRGITLEKNIQLESDKFLKNMLKKRSLGTRLEVEYSGEVADHIDAPFMKEERILIRQPGQKKAIIAKVEKISWRKQLISFDMGNRKLKIAFSTLFQSILFRDPDLYGMEDEEEENEDSVSLPYYTMEFNPELKAGNKRLRRILEKIDHPPQEPFKLWGEGVSSMLND